jgi:predicted dienelactone hydrolase
VDKALFTLPEPTGRAPIGTVSLHLVDRSREDPWVPSRSTRELMVQIWYPAKNVTGDPRAPWMSPGTAAGFQHKPWGVPNGAATLTHGHVGAPLDQRGGGRPVILYSHGFTTNRSLGTVLVEDLASRGYVVVTIDHTHDAGEVEFPDGRIAASAVPNSSDPAEFLKTAAKATQVRSDDARYVLDQLVAINRGNNPDAERRPLPQNMRGAFDLSKVGIFGHSLGGATAAGAMHDDRRFKAGIDMDGWLFGPVIKTGLDRPFMFMSTPIHGRHNDPDWTTFWNRSRGPKLDLKLLKSSHFAYSDLEVIIPQVAAALKLTPEQVTQMIGTLDGPRGAAVQRAYIAAFFDRYLRHRPSPLLRGPSADYPEVEFVR